MPVEQGPRAVRIFVSSPSDVGEERAFVHQLLDTELKYKRAFLGKLSFEVVSWDNPAAPTPMTARLTPQEAVNRFRGKPSDCDIVIVILWSRLGGHLIIDGMPYLSGTEYEYEEAASAQPPPEILVYRRTEKVLLDADDTEFDRKRQQRQRALSFFDRFGRPDGPFSGGINEYATPTDFKNLLTKNLREILTERLEVQSIGRPISTSAQPPVWQGHPYPGLRAFMTTEAAIFFGRGRETDALVAELRKPDRRFTAVVGASGSGKSSLVYAGLMPRLAEGAIEGSADWQAVYFKPGAFGDNPFLALAAELKLLLPSGDGDEPIVIADALARAPGSIAPYFDRVLAGAPSSTRLVLFADQSEEIFAQVASSRREPLVNLLAEASGHPRTQVVLTMREDFLSQATRYPRLAALLQTGTFVLGVPGPAALADMIRRPAQLAGLTLDEDLADEILKDVGNELGALPLVAFCLETLYLSRGTSHHLTRKAYEAVGRLQGVVRRRVAEILLPLRKRVETEVALAKLFRLLVHIDAAGAVSRRRAFRDELRDGPLLEKMVEVLITGRLLVADDPKRATISLAHEVLLTAWPALRSWVKTHRAELQRLDRALSSLDSVNPLDRSYAVQALGEIGPVVPDIVPALVTSLGDADFDVRRNAVESLARFGSPAIPALVAALKDADATVRMHAAEALEDTGPPAVGAVQGLITALGDGDEFVRMTVAAALGKIGLPAGQAVPALVAALSDTNETVRENAAEALEAIGPPGILALVAALKDADATVRMHAAEALEDTGPPAVGAVQGLITALGDGDEFVRMTAAAALGKFGLPAVEAVPALVAALSDTNETVRENAAEALEAMGLVF